MKAVESMLDVACTNMDMKLGGCTANSPYRCKEACNQIPEQPTVMFSLEIFCTEAHSCDKNRALPSHLAQQAKKSCHLVIAA